MTSEHERRNREFWDADADEYQVAHARQLERGKVWGAWAIPEEVLGALGSTRGLDVLELGCGAAHWSVALAADGARVIALDQSKAQLRYAASSTRTSGGTIRLVCASGEAIPVRDGSFDVVFCDHGAMSFCEPERSVAEVARVLRHGGRLVFNKSTMLLYLTYHRTKERQSRRLRASYFGSKMFDFAEGTVDFQLPYGEWIRLFAAHGMVVEDLIELRPPDGATTTYVDFVPYEWARAWPAEEIWKVRKS